MKNYISSDTHISGNVSRNFDFRAKKEPYPIIFLVLLSHCLFFHPALLSPAPSSILLLKKIKQKNPQWIEWLKKKKEICLMAVISESYLGHGWILSICIISWHATRKVLFSKNRSCLKNGLYRFDPFFAEICVFVFSFNYSYIYRAARRFPFVYAPTILALSIDYEHAVETCCARTDIGACLDEKVLRFSM